MPRASSRMLARVVVAMAALFVASSIVPAVSAAARLPGTSAAGALESVGTGGVAINGSATATANADRERSRFPAPVE